MGTWWRTGRSTWPPLSPWLCPSTRCSPRARLTGPNSRCVRVCMRASRLQLSVCNAKALPEAVLAHAQTPARPLRHGHVRHSSLNSVRPMHMQATVTCQARIATQRRP